MPLLIAIRHAKSSWSQGGLSDRQRPLNKRGQRAAPLVGQELKRRGAVPDLLLSSPARRAHDTARLICKALGLDLNGILVDDALYMEDWIGIAAAVGRTIRAHPECQSLAFFSHQPAISNFCVEFGGLDYGTHYPTGAACGMEFSAQDWAHLADAAPQEAGGMPLADHLRPVRGEQRFFILPRALESAS